MVDWGLSQNPSPRLRVCAVSFLNTTPLVWGMLHGAQRGLFDLDFRIPADCADRVASGAADIGIIPSFELTRLDLAVIPGAGIACHGAVRSILLVSSKPAAEIRTLAADSSSRTSVQLARVILERKYGASPAAIPHPPDLPAMLRLADAALVIGDPALRVDPAHLPYYSYDLGQEWVEMTGLPMVFAVWAGRREVATPEVTEAFADSCRFGRERIAEIVASEAPARGFPPELVREYLTRHIVHELGRREYQGMELFLRYARELAHRPEAARGALGALGRV
ncbi:MAG TPA: menaquinone biosynthesis protein [Candidatus Sulfopaludibacter sp.]|nr:menaquinone biosynthesis protein [Candidatus Sulfopaludibacter sp.]